MDSFRIVNFIIQAAYLAGHLLFLRALYRRRQPTPVWLWFFCLCIAAWLWVSGRFMESVVYLFFPGNNPLYQFAANYQYLGNTTAATAYLMWVLYLSGRDRLASAGWFRVLLFACPVCVCGLVFTNGWHHLFYTRLDMGERVEHGPLFLPCVLWSYLLLLTGYALSLRFALRNGRDRLRQIVMFSLFPLLPAAGILVRSITGVDRFDYTPIVMGISILSMYQIVFRLHYVRILPATIQEVIDQTAHPIGIFDRERGELKYANQIARREYGDAAREFLPRISAASGSFEGEFGGKHLIVSVVPLQRDSSILVTATDMSDIAREQAALEAQIRELGALQLELEEAKRNIDAYLDSLYSTGSLRHKQDMVAKTREQAGEVFLRVEENLRKAKQDAGGADAALLENLQLTRDCIADIRRTVAQIREA